MLKNALILFFALCVLPAGLAAQGIKGKSFWRSLVKKSVPAERSAASKAALSAAEYGSAQQALLRAAARAAYERALPPYQTAGLPGKISRSLVQVVSVSSGGLASGGFVFEEFARGKRTLWAAVPYHVAGGKGHPVTLRLRERDGSVRLYPTQVTIGGGWGRNALDVSLIRLPQELENQVFALRLSDRPAKPGSRVTAYGFTFRQNRPDRPLKVAQTAGVTAGFRLSGDGSLPDMRGGFCGAPVVGESGYVLGMHCASEGGETFSVTAAGIKELLRAHYFGRAEQPVFIKARHVFDIASSESIGRMTLKRAGKELAQTDVQSYSGPFSYGRAEQAFGSGQIRAGDEISFYITEHHQVTRVIRYRVPEEQ